MMFCIILLSIFACNYAGILLVFKWQQLQIRSEVEHRIKRGVAEDELSVITIHPANDSQLTWQTDDEFVYLGSMYDVVRKEMLADSSLVYFCIEDKNELELFANLDDLVKKNRQHDCAGNSVAEKFSKLLSLVYLNEKPPIVLYHLFISPFLFWQEQLYFAPDLSIIYPPPKTTVSPV